MCKLASVHWNFGSSGRELCHFINYCKTKDIKLVGRGEGVMTLKKQITMRERKQV